MKLSIKQTLRLAPVLYLILFILVVAISYAGEQRLRTFNSATRALEQQRMALQMLFRGINESLLTDGSPDSVAISKAGIATFDERYRELKTLASDSYLIDQLSSDIGPAWQALRDATPQFLKINDMNSEDDGLLVSYGRFLVAGTDLVDKVEELARYSENLSRDGARRVTQLVITVIVFSLLGMLGLFWYLYRTIAIPLEKLRSSMLDVSDGEGELLDRIDSHRQAVQGLDELAMRQEIPALRHSYQFMLTSVREHLTLRKKAESALQELNQGLEQQVVARTRALRVANDQMRAEIVQREQTQQDLERSKRDNARILESVGEGIYGADCQGRITFANRAAANMLGYEPAEMIGQNAHSLFHHTRADGEPNPAEECQALSAFQDRQCKQVEGEVFWHRNGTSFPVEYMANPVKEDGSVLGVVVVFRDVSEKQRSAEHIYRLAHYDTLTRLPNRTLFRQRLEQAMLQTQRRSRGLAVLFLDLDHFKNVNDTLGHPFGDRLLTIISRRLTDCLRSDDVVSRLGGDEFVVLLRDVNSSEDVARIAEQLIESIAKPVHRDEYQLSVGVSIGISLFPQDGRDVATLQRNADTAMYQAKAGGRGTYRFFTESMNRSILTRLELESELRKATAEGAFELAYQPQVRMTDGVVVGLEALLRWEHPVKGVITPDRFIPVAEESGLIVAIGEWVLRTACGQYRRWIDEAMAPGRFSVNLSARQFRDAELKDKVRDALACYDLDPRHLELELTESCVMEDPESSISILAELKELGVQVAVDDFGIAYSSLSYLKRLPIDRLKIDRSFIRDIPDDADDIAITRAIISMAHNLGLEVIAEGVETERQFEFLQKKGCDEMQGFLYSRPLYSRDLERLLRGGEQALLVTADAR